MRPHRPNIFFLFLAFVARKYSRKPAGKIHPSSSNVAGSEFHNPIPNRGDFPGYRDKSGLWTKR